MKRILSAVCCIALCSMPALAKEKAATGPVMSDQQFVDFAAQTDMVEANLGQLAESVASSQPVKDYAPCGYASAHNIEGACRKTAAPSSAAGREEIAVRLAGTCLSHQLR